MAGDELQGILQAAYDPTNHALRFTSTAYVSLLGPSNNSDDTTWLNAALALGGRIRGKPGQTYLISAPLVLPSYTELDMTGCFITLLPSSSCNMVNNTALSAARSVIDGAMTATSTTLTSATAAFTNADVGKTVTVVGADASGHQRLVTTIVSRTNSTTVVLADAAVSTVSAAWVTIGTRDTDITIIGGTWDRGANGQGTFGYTSHSLRLRRVDNVEIRGAFGKGTNGKYFVALGDCWGFRTYSITNDSFSDGVHVDGPARHGAIRDTHGRKSGDDIVSLSSSEFTTFATLGDTYGNISDVLVDGVSAEYGTRRGVLVLAGTAPASWGSAALDISRITVRNVRGYYANQSVVVGGDYQDTNTLGGTYNSILVENVQGDATSNTGYALVRLPEGTYNDITVRNIWAGAACLYPVEVGGAQATEIATVTRLSVSGVRWTGGLSPNAVVTVTHGTIEYLSVTDVLLKSASTGVSIVRVPTTTSPVSAITRCVIDGVYMEVATGGSVSALVSAQNTVATVTTVEIANVFTKNVTYPLGRHGGTVRTKALNCHFEGASGQIRVEATGVVTLEAANISTNTEALSIVAGGSLTCVNFGCRGDATTTGLAVTNGSMIYNTNSAVLGGVGPHVADGTVWRPVNRPDGTAVLVAGTKAVADTKITANSKIVVTNVAAGGTVGALSVALNAGVGFTVNSTSGSDTSTVYYEVVKY